MIRLSFIFVLITSLQLMAESPKPAIKKISEHELQIGKITLNQKTREITFGAGLNMNEGLIEYILVRNEGKVHESLFLTDISPINLNIALKLLNYQESPELFEIIDKEYNRTGKYPDVPAAQKKAARLQIDVRWKQEDKEITRPLNDLIYHLVTEKPMPPGPWLNTGSYMHDGRFKAEVAGDIIAVFTSQPAMINYPGEDRNDDEVWIPHKKVLPPLDTVVSLILKPTS